MENESKRVTFNVVIAIPIVIDKEEEVSYVFVPEPIDIKVTGIGKDEKEACTDFANKIYSYVARKVFGDGTPVPSEYSDPVQGQAPECYDHAPVIPHLDILRRRERERSLRENGGEKACNAP